MSGSNFSKAKRIPDVGTKKSAPTTTNFSKGWNTYLPNDLLEYEQVRIAQNVRFDKIGEYKTRGGLQALTEPIGIETRINTLSSAYNMVPTEGISYTFTVPQGATPANIYDKLYSLTLKLKANSEEYGIVQLILQNEDDEEVCSCAELSSTEPTNVEFKFATGLPINGHTFTLKIGPQNNTEQSFQIATLSDTPTTPIMLAKTAPGGSIIGLFEANIKNKYFVIFAYQVGELTPSIYVLNPDNQVQKITDIALDADITFAGRVRFSQNMDEVRYTFGGSPHKLSVQEQYDGGTGVLVYTWTDEAITTEDLQTETDLGIKVSNILTGTQDNLVYFDAETDTQAVWTNPYGLEWAKGVDYTTTAALPQFVVGQTKTATISSSTLEATNEDHLVSAIAVGDIITDENDNYGEVTSITGQNIVVKAISHIATAINSFDKFDRDFRQNFPAIKTGDPLTAMFNLGGVIYFLTRRNKYYMYSQTADVWTQQTSPAQHGTFSQESVACDLNFAYYANDDGIYVFNGSTEGSLTEKTIQDFYDKIQYKEKIVVELYNNRLYVFFVTGKHNQDLDGCLVYNINLKLWESLDTGTPINATIGRKSPSNRFICGSSTFGQLFINEGQNPTYADLGAPIAMDLGTAYLHFGTPSQLHRITKWRPEFATSTHSYKVKCGYALDFTDDVKYAFSIDLKDRTIWNEHGVWDNPLGYGNSKPTKLTTIPKVYGQFRRCQILYQHHAAFEPVNFKSHTLCCQTQRIR